MMPKVEYFLFDEDGGRPSRSEASLIEFSLLSLVIFGFCSSTKAIILPFTFVQAALLSGGKMDGIWYRNVSYWTPYALSEDEFEDLVYQLQHLILL